MSSAKYSGGQPRAGVDLGPNRLISAGLINQIAGLGWNVKYNTQQKFLDNPYNPTFVSEEGRKVLEDGDIGKMKKPRLVSAVCEKVAEKVGGIAEKGWLPLTLGGDHSLVRVLLGLYLCLIIGVGYRCWDKVEIPQC